MIGQFGDLLIASCEFSEPPPQHGFPNLLGAGSWCGQASPTWSRLKGSSMRQVDSTKGTLLYMLLERSFQATILFFWTGV